MSLCVSVICLLATISQVESSADSKRLYDDLIMKGYNKYCRPVDNFTAVTIVKIGVTLSQIVNVDEVNQILTVNLKMEQEWEDTRLKWSVEEYNGISMLHVPIQKIWRPDIVLYNNADGEYYVTTISKAIIHPSGRVSWKPPMQFKSYCEIDVEFFPLDVQKCRLKFGPWTHDTSKVDIQHVLQKENKEESISNAIVMDHSFKPHVEWDIMEVSADKHLVYYTCCVIPYADITFNITLKRLTLYYTLNLIIPCLSINLLTCLSFYLPSYSGEKISISISLFLSLSIFWLLLMELIPSSSIKFPLIGKHITMTSFLITISIVMNIVILCVNHRKNSTHEMSKFTRWLFLHVLSRLLYMKSPISEDSDPEPRNDSFTTSAFSDLSNYANPYAGEMLRRRSTLPVSNSFIGYNQDNQLTWDKFCDICVRKRLAKYPPNIRKGVDGICFIANHYSDEEDTYRVQDEWRYVALVFDRVLLLIYIVASLITGMSIFLNAPSLYDHRTPLTGTVNKTRIITYL